MTSQRTFKRRVRSRMAKTGESYTAARRMLIARGDHPESPTAAFDPPASGKAIAKATGRDWKGWSRGLPAPGQHQNGWAVTASKTIAVPVERLFEAFEDDAVRERWLPGAKLRLRTATAPRTARFDWENGSTRVAVGFARLAEAKSRVSLDHERLPDADMAEEMKAWWRERVAVLKAFLEAGEEERATPLSMPAVLRERQR
jgi:hypothetical protein